MSGPSHLCLLHLLQRCRWRGWKGRCWAGPELLAKVEIKCCSSGWILLPSDTHLAGMASRPSFSFYLILVYCETTCYLCRWQRRFRDLLFVFSPKSRLREETKNGRHQSKVGSLPVTQTIQTETCERRDYHFRVKQTGRQQTGRTSVRALGMAAAPSWPPTFTTALEKGLQLQNWTQQRAPWPRGCAPHLEAPDDSIAQRPSGHGTEASRLECSNCWHKLLAPEQLRAVDECSPEW